MAVGMGVQYVEPGDSVVLHWRKGDGIEAAPPKYNWRGQTANAGWVTTFNEYAIVSENRVTRVSPDLDARLAALFGCAITTGFGVIQNNARLKIGESIVVFGAGGVGLSIVQAASMVSAYPIIGVDIHDNRLELARRMGATHMINSANGDARTAIEAALEGKSLDVFVDNTGSPAVIELGYDMSSPQGRVVLVGVPGFSDNVAIHSLPLHFGK